MDRERGDKPRSGLPRHPLAYLLGLLLFTSAASYLVWDLDRHFQSTDDAFIAALQYAIAAKVSGYITAVPVTDNLHVVAGDVIARIDDRDYRTALDQAHAQAASAEASIENIDAQKSVQQAQISADHAQLDQAQAALVFTRQQAARYPWLVEKDSGSVQNAQQYTSQLHQREAAVESAQATLKLAQRQVEALKAQRNNAVANLAQAKAQRDRAQLNLSSTTVIAARPKYLIVTGAVVIALSMYALTNVYGDLGFWFLARSRMLLGIGLPLIFVAITTASYDGIPPEKTDRASALINAARNTAGSIGISLASNVLAHRQQFHQSRLVESVIPSSTQYQDTLQHLTSYFVAQGSSVLQAQQQAIQWIGQQVQTQASFLAYMDSFWMLALISLAAVPLALALRKVKLGGPAPAGH